VHPAYILRQKRKMKKKRNAKKIRDRLKIKSFDFKKNSKTINF